MKFSESGMHIQPGLRRAQRDSFLSYIEQNLGINSFWGVFFLGKTVAMRGMVLLGSVLGLLDSFTLLSDTL